MLMRRLQIWKNDELYALALWRHVRDHGTSVLKSVSSDDGVLKRLFKEQYDRLLVVLKGRSQAGQPSAKRRRISGHQHDAVNLT